MKTAIIGTVILLLLTAGSCDKTEGKASEIYPGYTFPADVPPGCVEPVKQGLDWVTLHAQSTDPQLSVTVSTESAEQSVVDTKGRYFPTGEVVESPFCSSVHYRPGKPVSVIIRASSINRNPAEVVTCFIKNRFGTVLNQSVVSGSSQAVCSVTVS